MTSNNSASNGLKLQRNEGLKKFVINRAKHTIERLGCCNSHIGGTGKDSYHLYTFTLQKSN
jgi:hypothetical protein